VKNPLYYRRIAYADEIVRRADTVTLLRCDEVVDLRRRALTGEFDERLDEFEGD
jgi:hypothetical protein